MREQNEWADFPVTSFLGTIEKKKICRQVKIAEHVSKEKRIQMLKEGNWKRTEEKLERKQNWNWSPTKRRCKRQQMWKRKCEIWWEKCDAMYSCMCIIVKTCMWIKKKRQGKTSHPLYPVGKLQSLTKTRNVRCCQDERKNNQPEGKGRHCGKLVILKR